MGGEERVGLNALLREKNPVSEYLDLKIRILDFCTVLNLGKKDEKNLKEKRREYR